MQAKPRVVLIGLVLSMLTLTSGASLKQLVTPVNLIGQANYRFLAWRVYHIALYAKNKRFSWRRPFALKLTYHRKLAGKDIVAESLKQMQRQAPLTPKQQTYWRKKLLRIIPTVYEGTSLTGVYNGRSRSSFYLNHKRFLGSIRSARFANLFFGIWLKPNQDAPGIHSQLLGR